MNLPNSKGRKYLSALILEVSQGSGRTDDPSPSSEIIILNQFSTKKILMARSLRLQYNWLIPNQVASKI